MPIDRVPERCLAFAAPEPVLERARSSTLLPALAHPDQDQAAGFLHRHRAALPCACPPQADGRTPFPFRRPSIVAPAYG